ncbi:MAG TPA: DUF92 domain-containing protein [bacterium]
MPPLTTQLLTGGLLSAAAAGLGWRTHALTAGGALAAVVVGTAIYAFGGVSWAVLLLLFFATSSLLTFAGGETKVPKPDRAGRSAGQVLANGAVAAALAVLHAAGPTPWVTAAYAGAIAAATADTWATEIGLLSKTPPRLITTGKICATGQSGGITWLGTRGGIAGAGVIAVAGNLLMGTSVWGVLAAGAVAMFADSVLGATLEARWRVLTNNTVNLLTTSIGALIAALFA